MVTRDADWAGKTRDVSRMSCRAQSALRVTVRHRMNVLDSICYNHNYGNHSNMTDSKLPLLKRSLTTISCQLHHPVFLIWVFTFSHTFAMKSVRCIHIFWPLIPSRGIYSHTHYFDPGDILVHPWLFFFHPWHIFNKHKMAATQNWASL